MKEFFDFLLSPIGLAVYAMYRLVKLYVWSRVLPRILPYFPTPIRIRIERVQVRVANLRAGLPSLSDVSDFITMRLLRPMKECCFDRT